MGLATISPSGLVEPAFPYIILTNLSIRVAKLEDINQISTEYLCFSHRLEPFLVGYVPTDSTRIEKGKTIVLGELLRTVVGTVILEHVAIVIIIGGTECPVLTVVGKLRTRSTLRAVEYAHSCYIVLAELASPIELCLIEEVTLGKIVVECTRISLPCDGLHKIKVIFTAWLLLIGYHTRYRVDILILGCMVEVVDTSACLHKYVIPRYDGRCLQSLSNKGKILLERKVGVDTGCGG